MLTFFMFFLNNPTRNELQTNIPKLLVCVWLGGVVVFFQRFNPFKAQITPPKAKNTCFLCGPHKKKSQSHLQTKHSKEAKLPTKLGTLALGFAPNNNELLKYVWESGDFCDCGW